MAVPGETECRLVAPCGEGKWGDIPVDASTQFVDGSYSGTDSDGTAEKPWTTIQAGVNAAAPDAVVAVAKGTYAEDVEVSYAPVRVWGRCPSLVEVTGTGGDLATILILSDADGTVVRNLAVAAPTAGIVVSGVQDVLLEKVWVHDTDNPAIGLQDTLGKTSLTCRGCLVELARRNGLFVNGADAVMEASVIRDMVELDDGAQGITVQISPEKLRRSSATVRGSVVEHNPGVGVFVLGSDLAFDASVVRDTLPLEAAVEDQEGRGIHVQYDPTTFERANAVVRASVIERSHDVGIATIGSDAAIENTVIRGTKPQPSMGMRGFGLSVEPGPAAADRGNATVRWSVVEQNHTVGIVVKGSDATVEASIVRATEPQQSDQSHGVGISIEAEKDTGQRSTMTARTTLVEKSHAFGIMVLDSDATLEHVLVRATEPQIQNGGYGDGLAVAAQLWPATALLTASRIETSARAGISVFGATATIGTTILDCNAIDLDGEELGGAAYTLQDVGGNTCGCKDALVTCSVVSSHLEPPKAVPR
jgi:hypothetical protein